MAIEILFPCDRFPQLDKKCRCYAEWGVPDILVLDPMAERAWHWDTAIDGLLRVAQTYRFGVSRLRNSCSRKFWATERE